MDHYDYGPTTKSVYRDKSFKTYNPDEEHMSRIRLLDTFSETSEKYKLPFVTSLKHQKHDFSSNSDIIRRCDEVYNIINLFNY